MSALPADMPPWGAVPGGGRADSDRQVRRPPSRSAGAVILAFQPPSGGPRLLTFRPEPGAPGAVAFQPVPGTRRRPRPATTVQPAPARPTRLGSARSIAPRRVPATRPAPVRLTRRGQMAVGVLAVMVAGGLGVAGATVARAVSGSAASRAPAGGAERVIVEPGDTLWSIAKAADPGADTRTIVQQMLQVNRLTGPGIRAGQRLWVPHG